MKRGFAHSMGLTDKPVLSVLKIKNAYTIFFSDLGIPAQAENRPISKANFN